jgi:hypothetical protein
MKYAVEYFHCRVKDEIEGWPDGIIGGLCAVGRAPDGVRPEFMNAAFARHGRRSF